jgi:hypothetical protein
MVERVKKSKLKIGDVFQLKTPGGFIYGQYTHHGEDMGQLVRVLPGTYSARPLDFATLASQKELYFVFFTLELGLRAKQVEIVSNQPIPEWAKEFPIMRRRGGIDRQGQTQNWIIGHGLRLYTVPDIQRAFHVRELTPEQRKLSIPTLMSPQALTKAIMKCWTPERDEEINIEARRRATEEQQKRGPGTTEQPTFIDHYLYFPKTIQAEIAARRLKAKGWTVIVRMGADGENWLALAKQPAPIDPDIEEVREELERLAEELNGEYDGWGAPVAE